MLFLLLLWSVQSIHIHESAALQSKVNVSVSNFNGFLTRLDPNPNDAVLHPNNIADIHCLLRTFDIATSLQNDELADKTMTTWCENTKNPQQRWTAQTPATLNIAGALPDGITWVKNEWVVNDALHILYWKNGQTHLIAYRHMEEDVDNLYASKRYGVEQAGRFKRGNIFGYRFPNWIGSAGSKVTQRTLSFSKNYIAFAKKFHKDVLLEIIDPATQQKLDWANGQTVILAGFSLGGGIAQTLGTMKPSELTPQAQYVFSFAGNGPITKNARSNPIASGGPKVYNFFDVADDTSTLGCVDADTQMCVVWNSPGDSESDTHLDWVYGNGPEHFYNQMLQLVPVCADVSEYPYYGNNYCYPEGGGWLNMRNQHKLDFGGGPNALVDVGKGVWCMRGDEWNPICASCRSQPTYPDHKATQHPAEAFLLLAKTIPGTNPNTIKKNENLICDSWPGGVLRRKGYS